MIYVRVELWPLGNRNRARLLGEARIANMGGFGSDARGNYEYELTGKAGSKMGIGTINDFPRKRLMAWDLLYRVLRDARLRFNPDKAPEST